MIEPITASIRIQPTLKHTTHATKLLNSQDSINASFLSTWRIAKVCRKSFFLRNCSNRIEICIYIYVFGLAFSFAFNCFKSYKIQILVQHIQLLRQLGRGSRRDLFVFAISKPQGLFAISQAKTIYYYYFFFYPELFHILTIAFQDVVTLVIRCIEKKRIFRGNGKLVWF